MSTVHAPYHFVPLSKWVYMPDWAHLVSHDHPFEDGHSGVIEYTLTNHTPLCVGSDKIGNLVKFARDPKGNPIVPGSSLKGMIRNVLEIASFGKFSAVDDQRFSYRDFRSESYKSQMENIARTISGWLKFDDGKWVFTESQNIPIFMDELNTYAKTSIDPSKHGFKAIDAYKQHSINNEISFDIGRREFSYNHPEAKGQSVESARLNSKGKNTGNIIFSNFRISITPQKNNVKNRKLLSKNITDFEDKKTVKLRTGFSYVFYNNGEVIQFDNLHDEYQYLLSQYSEDELKTIMPPEHEKYGIPIFAHVDARNRLIALSFSKMPKFKYNKSIINMIDSLSKSHGSAAYFDMAELMFGTLRENGLGLKSRVFFSDAVGEKGSQSKLYKSNNLILAEPKATFYPAYLEQNKGESSNRDYNDSNATLSGFKRYIAKKPKDKKLKSNALDKFDSNSKVIQQLELAPEGSQFTGKVVFHNLKSVELSALMWCLNLQGSYHQLGHGKPMGAGSVTLNCCLSSVCSNSTQVEDFEHLFEQHMEDKYPDSWVTSPQLQYLSQISQLQEEDDKPTYMPLSSYQSAKKEKFPELGGIKRTSLIPEGVSTSFGRGRLFHLLDANNPWDTEQVNKAKRIKDQQEYELEQQRKVDAIAERRANLSTHENMFFELEENLAKVDKNERPPLIREVIHYFLREVDETESNTAKALFIKARECGYHQTPKKRAKDQKIELEDLMSKYGFTV